MALTKVIGAGVEGVTISSTTDTSDQFILTNTDTGSSSGPDLVLFRQSTSSAADSDGIGRIDYRGLNDANQEINYATTYAKISDASDGTEDGEFYIQQIKGGSYVTTLKIDSNGVVAKPLQPSFAVVGVNNDSTLTMVDGTVVKLQNWDTVRHNIGSHFNASSGVFTAPVAGRYFFYVQVMFRMSTSTYIGDLLFRLRKNGSDMIHTDIGYNDDSNGDGWNTETMSAILDLAVNDTVDVHYYLGSSTHNTGDNTNWYIYNGNYTQFHGHFLG